MLVVKVQKASEALKARVLLKTLRVYTPWSAGLVPHMKLMYSPVHGLIVHNASIV